MKLLIGPVFSRMNQVPLGLILSLVAVALLIGCSPSEPAGKDRPVSGSQDSTLRLFIWSEYIDPKVIEDFETRFDCEMIVDVFEEAESMMAKIQGGGPGLYDLVVAPDYIIPAMIELELLEPLRKKNVPNLKNLGPKFLDPPFDPGNQYTAAYQWGTLGVYARIPESKKETLPRSWGLIFHPNQQPGPILLMDSMRDTIGAGLKYLGHSMNTTNPAHLKAVRDLILKVKDQSLGFENSVGAKNKVVAGVAQAAIVYSGEAARGMEEDPGTRYIIPKEGSQIWVDNLAVLKGSNNRNLAERFIDYILDGKVGARISNWTQFATPNDEAKPFIKPQLLSNPSIYPKEEVMQRLEFLRDLGNETRLYDETWTYVKSK